MAPGNQGREDLGCKDVLRLGTQIAESINDRNKVFSATIHLIAAKERLWFQFSELKAHWRYRQGKLKCVLWILLFYISRYKLQMLEPFHIYAEILHSLNVN